jgi:hypothetical protein
MSVKYIRPSSRVPLPRPTACPWPTNPLLQVSVNEKVQMLAMSRFDIRRLPFKPFGLWTPESSQYTLASSQAMYILPTYKISSARYVIVWILWVMAALATLWRLASTLEEARLSRSMTGRWGKYLFTSYWWLFELTAAALTMNSLLYGAGYLCQVTSQLQDETLVERNGTRTWNIRPSDVPSIMHGGALVFTFISSMAFVVIVFALIMMRYLTIHPGGAWWQPGR